MMYFQPSANHLARPTPEMINGSVEALQKFCARPLGRIANYMDFGSFVGNMGDCLATVALGHRNENEQLPDQPHLLPAEMSIRGVSKIINERRVAIGFNPARQEFAVASELLDVGAESCRELWQVQSTLGRIIAHDISDVGTFVRYESYQDPSEPIVRVSYPFNQFSSEVRSEPHKVYQRFAFGLQETAGVLLEVHGYPATEK